MQPGGKVPPHEEHEHGLLRADERIDPEAGHLILVGNRASGQQRGHPRVRDVREKQPGNRNPHQELRRLPARHPQVPPAPEHEQAERGVGEQAAIEQRLAGEGVPHGHDPGPGGFLGLERNQPEGMIQQVHRREDSDDHTGGGAHLQLPGTLDRDGAHGSGE
jgi:hypothetical protein